MTARNSILLIIKQCPAIEYNALLNKISPGYGSITSARAALSRALKDLSALGLIQRRKNQLFATDKGASEINREMKNKLLLKLNQLIGGRSNIQEIDTIVEMLHNLIERSKQDTDLLKAAKGSTDFFINDLVEMKRNLEKRANHLSYLGKVFEKQIQSLQELDFNDYRKMPFNSESTNLVSLLIEKFDSNEIIGEVQNKTFLEKVQEQFKEIRVQDRSVFFEKKHIPALLQLIEQNKELERNIVNLYFSSLKVKVDFPNIFFIGPTTHLQKLFPE
jgi:hypothetical protein